MDIFGAFLSLTFLGWQRMNVSCGMIERDCESFQGRHPHGGGGGGGGGGHFSGISDCFPISFFHQINFIPLSPSLKLYQN